MRGRAPASDCRVVATGSVARINLLAPCHLILRAVTLAASRVAELSSMVNGALGEETTRTPAPEQPAALATERARANLDLIARAVQGLLALDRKGRVLHVSTGLRHALGYDDQAPRASGLELVNPEDWPTVRSAVDSVLARDGAATSFEIRAEHADGRWVWLEACATNLLEEPMVGAVVLTFRDISDRKSYEDDLRHRALHDTLTGVPNRTLLIDRLSGAIWRSGRDGRSVTVFFLDLDDFKVVNDTLGHAAGDEVLVGVAGRLAAVARAQDTVARFGGDEFVLVIEHDQGSGWVLAFAERIRAVFAEPIRADGHLVTVSASFGIATATGTTPSPDSLLRDADAAMYRAKETGGNAYRLFDDSMVDETVVDLTVD